MTDEKDMDLSPDAEESSVESAVTDDSQENGLSDSELGRLD